MMYNLYRTNLQYRYTLTDKNAPQFSATIKKRPQTLVTFLSSTNYKMVLLALQLCEVRGNG